jgi:uncharacterized protein YabE (DUF348 family)
LAQSVRPSPARARPADRGAWLPVPDLAELPELEELVDPQDLVAPRSSRPEGNVRPTPVRPRPSAPPSPARARPHDPDAWLPVPDVDLLPELEELLAPDKLVPEPEIEQPAPTPSAPPDPEPHPVIALRAPRSRPSRPAPTRPGPRPSAPLRPEHPHAPVVLPEPEASPDDDLLLDDDVVLAEPELELREQPETRQERIRRVHRRRRRGWRAVVVGATLTTATTIVALVVPRIVSGSPEVGLLVDGKRVSFSTDADTVGALLRRRGVELREGDRVVPPPSTEITDGLDISVVRAVPVAIDHDGVKTRVRSSQKSPDELLKELGLDPAEYALVDPPRALGRGSEPLKIRSINDATINVDGASVPMRTPALTVGEFLEQNGVVLNGSDTVSPPPETPISDGITVEVKRVTGEVETVTERVEPPTERRDDGSVPHGQEKVVQEGEAGEARVTYQVKRENDQIVERTPISNVVVKPPVPRIIAVGTHRPEPAASASVAASPGGGSRTGSASWYQSPFGDHTCATKEYIPKGTTITVTNLDTGQSIPCLVADRVEANRVVDMDREAFAQLQPPHLGVFNARVDW